MKKYKNLSGRCRANSRNCPRKADMEKMERLIEDLGDIIMGLVNESNAESPGEDDTITWAELKKQLGRGEAVSA